MNDSMHCMTLLLSHLKSEETESSCCPKYASVFESNMVGYMTLDSFLNQFYITSFEDCENLANKLVIGFGSRIKLANYVVYDSIPVDSIGNLFSGTGFGS